MFKVFFGLLLSFYVQLCSAVIIAEWDLSGNVGDESFVTAATSAVNVAGINLSRGVGLTARTTADSFNSGQWHDLQIDDYISFGFSVSDGFAVDLTNLEIALRSSNTGPGFLSLFYSGDGFSNSLATFTQSGGVVNQQMVDLTSLHSLTGQVEFRIQAINTVSANGGTISSLGTFRIDEPAGNNVLFNGVVTAAAAVPEPQAYLMFIAGLGLLSTAMRHKKSRY